MRSLYEPHYNHSDVNFHHLERYPRFRSVVPDFELEVRPGELLYLPPHWWHTVVSEGATAAVQIVWQSEPRHRTLRGPRVRLAVHATPKLRNWQLQISGRLARWRGLRPKDEAWMGSADRIAWRQRHNAAVDAARDHSAP